jgi:hypothetical protein
MLTLPLTPTELGDDECLYKRNLLIVDLRILMSAGQPSACGRDAEMTASMCMRVAQSAPSASALQLPAQDK